MAGRETVSVRVDPNLWKQAKIYAVRDNLKIGELVEASLKKEIKIR